jgi:murein L,D-transpeptidase YcbB/YkuD
VKDGKTGVVTALDITHDPSNGVNTHAIADYLRVKRDPRIKYVISNHRIWSSVQSPYTWRKYTGSNPHVSHMHVSVHSQKSHYDSERDWDLFANAPVPPVDPDSPAIRPTVKRGSKGPFVTEVQTVLDLRADGIFGPITEEGVKRFQRGAKLVVDGIVGPKTWAALDRIEQRKDGEHDGDLFEGEPA